MPIWILQGSTGEYSDRTDWIVRAYTDQAKANADCTKANDEARDFKKLSEEKELWLFWGDEGDKMEQATRKASLTIDPTARFDYTGTTYWVVQCELV